LLIIVIASPEECIVDAISPSARSIPRKRGNTRGVTHQPDRYRKNRADPHAVPVGLVKDSRR
jgi:hypothetical protein